MGDWWERLFGSPKVKATGQWVHISRDKDGQWLSNGKPVADGYRYYENGNTYQIRNGQRILIKQDKTAAKRSQKWQKEMQQRTTKFKKKDEAVATKPTYGWSTENKTLGGFSRRRLKRNVDPSARLDFSGVLGNFVPFTFNTGAWYGRDFEASPAELNIWSRHLGFPRSVDAMPVTGIRFSGDFTNTGAERLPNAEYSGLTPAAKAQIKKDIQTGDIKVNPDGTWTPVRESSRYNRQATSQYANYSIRENNNSGIYDVFDTYDFSNGWYFPNLNRPSGFQIEFRDTIHGKNADDRLYNPNFTVK